MIENDLPGIDPADADGGPEHFDCQTVEDFFAPRARDSIGRHCQRFLDDNALTPTELLHSSRHQQTLSNQPSFVGILQQAERACQRKGDLTALVNEVARVVRERLKAETLPELKPRTFSLAIERLLQTDSVNGRFLAEAAITAELQPCRTFLEKAKLLLELAGSTLDADALSLIDRVLGELVRSEAAIASLTGDAPFARTIDLIVTLVAADRPLDEEAPAVIVALKTLLGRAPMPTVMDGLMISFRRELVKPVRFTIASAGDLYGIESVQREVQALAALSDRLRSGEGFFGGERTELALQRRSALLVNEDTLPEIVRGQSFIQKLRTLFALEKMPLPPTSQRALTKYLLQFFNGREFAGRLLDCWKDRADKLKGLAEVQRLVLDSGLGEEDREYLADQIDELQSTFLRTQRVLMPLTSRVEPTPDKVVEIVKLAADGAFCRGRSALAAARALYRQVHRPRFVRAFLLAAPGGRERAARAAWLRSALGTVGVPFIDLSAIRALVVDDEEGPRGFVQSVLTDLGIGSIETAVDGRDALDRFAIGPDAFDLIVCDWMMPRTTGIDVLRQVRASRPDLPFLMVTALATLKAVETAMEHHVTAYIAKPFTPEQLEEKVFLVLTQKDQPAA